MNGLLLSSFLPAADVLARLAALEREWRESAQPAAIRALPALRLRVLLRDNRFRMYVVGLRPERLFTFRGRLTAVCVGQVRSMPDGCVIEAHYTPTRGEWTGLAIRLAIGVAICVWGAWIFGCFVAAAFGGEFAIWWNAAGEQRAVLRTVLADVIVDGPRSAPAATFAPAP